VKTRPFSARRAISAEAAQAPDAAQTRKVPKMLQNGGTTTAADTVVKDTTTQTFAKDVLEESRRQPVLVDFWAPWCGPCRQLTPLLEKAVRNAKGKAKLVKMNIDDHPAIPGQMGIQSIPAVIAFINGQPIDGFMGALPESQVTAFIERLIKGKIGGEEADLIKLADAALVEGDPVEAAELYARVLEKDPANVHALAGLARCQLETGDVATAKQTLALVPEAKRNEAPVAAARAALEVAEQAQSLGPIVELEQKVTANPRDHQARYDLALALNAQGNREGAVDQLLEVVRRDRKWNDDAARKQLVQLFEAWGPTDEATVAGRRRLSSILFA
jgi:putative thioredoxin